MTSTIPTPDAAARIRAYLNACPDADSFGRETLWELRDANGNPYDLPRADLETLLNRLAAVEKAVRDSYPWECDSPTHNRICHLRALTPVNIALGYGDPDTERPEYVAYGATCADCAAKAGAE